LSPLALLGLIAVFAIARFALSFKPFAAGAAKLPAVAIVREYLDAFVIAGLVALFLITFVIRTFYIPSISMMQTLQVGDDVLVDELTYHLHAPRPGDIAVFTPPVPSAGSPFIKRVIGVPGDTIRIADGIVYRNGKAMIEPYENQPPAYNLQIRNYGIYVDDGTGTFAALRAATADVPPRSMWQASNKIPAGFYFMMGDNRNNSEDSHVWGFAQLHGGFVAGPLAHKPVAAAFAGRAFLIFWPPGRLHILR